MPLLGFQKPAHAACLRHIHKQERVKWNILPDGKSIDIHPPLVVSASVSSGKSVLIAEIAKAVKDAAQINNRQCRVLVLQRQSELGEQNSEAGWAIGLNNSVYAASLRRKSVHYDVVYATEKTVANALNKEFDEWHPHLVLIDECHMVNYLERQTQFASILLHFYLKNPSMRVIGYTGSPFRDMELIIGDYWRSFAKIEPGEDGYPEDGQGNGIVSTEFMIANGLVVPPMFGWPDEEEANSYDFSHLKTKSGSWDFDEEALNAATSDIDKLMRIMAEVIERTKDRGGVLIFGSTHKHLHQIKAVMMALGVPEDQIGSITDKTGEKERRGILDRARAGKCKFVLNVGVLTTGINIPWWDTCVFLRPIGSIVLLIQAIGRVLRLLLEGGMSILDFDSMSVEERLAIIAASPKPNALIMDYGGVFDRLRDQYENPLLEQAEKEHATRKNELIECPACHEMNSMYARRCIGVSGGRRCEYFFQSKRCPDCGTKNDIVARACRDCGRQLIDPNEALSGKHYTDTELTPVLSMTLEAGSNGKLMVKYVLSDGREPYEIYYPSAGNNIEVNKRIYYNNLVKMHITSPAYRAKARNFKASHAVAMAGAFSTPSHIAARWNEKTNKWNIGRKSFKSATQGVSGVVEDDE